MGFLEGSASKPPKMKSAFRYPPSADQLDQPSGKSIWVGNVRGKCLMVSAVRADFNGNVHQAIDWAPALSPFQSDLARAGDGQCAAD